VTYTSTQGLVELLLTLRVTQQSHAVGKDSTTHIEVILNMKLNVTLTGKLNTDF